MDLYYAATGNGIRGAIMVAESGLPCTLHKLDLSKGETKTPQFLAINPAGQIPVLVDGDLKLAQSAAITIYLAEKSGKLLPAAGAKRAKTFEAMMQVMTDLAPAASAIFMAGRMWADRQPEATAAIEKRALDQFKVIDARLGRSAFLAGDECTIADIAAYPLVWRFKSTLDKHPPLANLARWSAVIAARPGVAKGIAAA